MYPKFTKYRVKESTTLQQFMANLGEDIFYAYERHLVGVIVNGFPKWSTAKLEVGDEVMVFPIMAGG